MERRAVVIFVRFETRQIGARTGLAPLEAGRDRQIDKDRSSWSDRADRDLLELAQPFEWDSTAVTLVGEGRIGEAVADDERAALDDARLTQTVVMAYAAKAASAFYGPFRDAAGSTPAFGDRRGYQMDPANRREAMREIALDVDEGADIVMIKPALPQLDLIAEARARWDLPIAAYQVSGEYAMLAAAAERGWLDRRRATLEALTGIARAGADIVITYAATDVCNWLSEEAGT